MSDRSASITFLTAPFGGSPSPEAPYSARSGTKVSGREYPTNTWRNNFGIQKGVGCPAALRVEDARAPVVQSFAVPTADEVRADQLPDEPPDAALNTGVGAEVVIAKDLQSCGWKVRYRANQAWLGYDLEATRDDQTLRVEVKSSIAFTQLELQESEWTAAQAHQDTYVLAVVDFYGSPQQSIWYVRNPAANALPVERATLTYRFVRANVQPLAIEVDFL